MSGAAALSDAEVRTGGPRPHHVVRSVRAFVAVFSTDPGSVPPSRSRLRTFRGWHATPVFSANRKAELAFTDTGVGPRLEPLRAGCRLTLVVGDDAEWDETQGRSCMASAACVEWDPARGSLRVVSSIAGLPPVFIHREPGTVIVASELSVLRAVAGARAEIDPRAAVELFTIGYPLEHRTLLKDVMLMPGGHSLSLDTQGRAQLTRAWEPPGPRAAEGGSSSIDRQAEAFRQAMRRLCLSESVFALTGGLDTRAILAALCEEGRRLPACTMSGAGSLCLDARLARALCQAYGLPHVVVAPDDRFLSDLPAYVVEASQLSGGLASVEQAHEVYFYRRLEGIGARRLSGNLGNQVGRQAPEGVSMRSANTAVLHDAVRADANIEPGEHWLISAARSGYPLSRLLIEYEYPVSSVANYSIGHHFMLQQSPYASRQLIETVLEAPLGRRERHSIGPRRARLRDIRHRFLGPPQARSFQRKVIEAAGGAVADCPINWGWRARGGVSLRGLGWGALALADAASLPRRGLWKSVRRGLRVIGAVGTHEIKPCQAWLDTVLRDFVNDTLRARRVRDTGLFDATAVVRLLDEYYRGVGSHYDTVVATLDLALAEQHLITAPSREP